MSTQKILKEFEIIYKNTYNKILKYVICKCSNLDDVNDIIQETYIEFYKNYLDEIDLENYVIADFDFLVDLKKTELKDLIETSPKKIDELLKHKKSEDRTKLVELLEDFLQQDSKEGLEEMLSYLRWSVAGRRKWVYADSNNGYVCDGNFAVWVLSDEADWWFFFFW